MRHFLGFCGNRVTRGELLDSLTDRYGLHQDIFVIGDEMVRAINSYRIHFNQNIGCDINARSFEALACRTVLLTNWNPQYAALGFVDGANCLMYRDPDELHARIEQYSKDDRMLDEIAEGGFLLSRRHTFVERVRALVHYLEENEPRLRSRRRWGRFPRLRNPFSRLRSRDAGSPGALS